MDEFTYSSYSFECNLFLLSFTNYLEEIESFQPDLLFVESAWKGKDELWKHKITNNSKELKELLQWCNTNKTPTLFWSKEDPVHFQTFLDTARGFDFVFTTDIECISGYKDALRHDKVYLLPFALQPKLNNPIELYDREDAFCFAGSYYKKYIQRTRELNFFVSHLSKLREFVIYDRNYHNNIESFEFPQKYNKYIKGNLPFKQINKAYKGYNYAINLNSVTESKTMFARRVFELLGSNTVVVSNYSKGVYNFFGELVINLNSKDEFLKNIQKTISNPIYMAKLKLAGLRKVLQEHTYEDRLNYICSKVFDKQISKTPTNIAMLTYINTQKDLEYVISIFNKQTYKHKKLYQKIDCFGF
jgi:spore maturation protein CgeB